MKKKIKNRIVFLKLEHERLCSKIDKLALDSFKDRERLELQGLLRGVTKELLFLSSLK